MNAGLGSVTGTSDTFAERIKWETLARVVALSGLLIFAVSMDLGLGPQPIAQLPEVVLYKLVTAFFVASFVALLATYLTGPKLRRPLAWASLSIDLALAMSLVTITHATESVFLFGLPLAVLAGAALLERPGAFVAASVSSVAVAILALIDGGLVAVDLEPWTVAWLRALGPRDVPAPFEVGVQALVQVGALYGTALLSSQLVIELNRARARASAERRELVALRVRYEDVWSSLPDGLATLSKKGVVLTANPAFLRILDLSEAEVVDQPLQRMLPQLDLDASGATTTVEIPRAGVNPTSEVWRARTDGGRQILAMRAELLRDGEGRPTGETLLVVRDVTAARRREQDHRNRERLATVGAMAMAVAHEIRNPLASISGAVQMLDATLEVSEEDRSLMQIAVRETQQLSDWIGEFLDYAKPGGVHFEPIDLAAELRGKVAALEQDPRVTEAGVTLQLSEVSGDCRLLADRKGVSAVVWNLLRNAVDAVVEADRREVHASLRTLPDVLVLAVSDSGPGVPEAERAQLFEPFFTTRAEGTGLGLATVKRVLDNHGGEVLVDDSPLGGARFTVTLPRDPRRGSRTAIPQIVVDSEA